jgi:hypothetical protein
MPITIKCLNCGKEFKVKPSRAKRGCKYCSMECREEHQYTGRFIRSDGYVAIKVKGKFELEAKKCHKLAKEALEYECQKKHLQADHKWVEIFGDKFPEPKIEGDVLLITIFKELL